MLAGKVPVPKGREEGGPHAEQGQGAKDGERGDAGQAPSPWRHEQADDGSQGDGDADQTQGADGPVIGGEDGQAHGQGSEGRCPDRSGQVGRQPRPHVAGAAGEEPAQGVGGQDDHRQRRVHAEPGHLLAHPGVADDSRGGPEHQETFEGGAADGEVERDGSDRKGQGLYDPAQERREAVGPEEGQEAEGSDGGEEPGAGAAAQGEVEERGPGERQGQELVGGQEHDVVEVRLVAAADVVLRQPVVQRVPDAAGEPGSVCAEGGEQEGVGNVEGGGRDQPDTPVPAQADSGGSAQQDQHRGDAEPLLPAQRIQLEAQGLQREPGRRCELGQGERPQDDEHVGGGRALLEAETLAHPPDQGPEGGDDPGPGEVSQEIEGKGARRLLRVLPALAGQVGGQPQVEEDQQQGDVDEGVFFGCEAEAQQGGAEIQEQGPSFVDVAPEGDDDAQGEHGHVDVVAGEAAEVQQRGGEGDERRGQQRPQPPQAVAEEEGQDDEGHAEQGGEDAHCVVAGTAAEEEGERRAEELEGAVQKGVVHVAVAPEQIIGVEAVQALIVVEGAGAQVPEADASADDDEGGVGHDLPGEA